MLVCLCLAHIASKALQLVIFAAAVQADEASESLSVLLRTSQQEASADDTSHIAGQVVDEGADLLDIIGAAGHQYATCLEICLIASTRSY